MSRPTFLQINLAALKHNFAEVKRLANKRAVLAMVKANAYGHGAVPIAKALAAADALGVASIDEGLVLRAAGIKNPIVLVEGLFYADEIREAEQQQFTLVVHHAEQVAMLEKATISKPFAVWLKINTGMHRLGVNPKEVPALLARLTALSTVQKPIGLMTHFAEADMINSPATHAQIDLFNTITKPFVGPRSLANSAGLLAWPQAEGDWVRPGLMLYGASPFPDKTGLDHHLQPVMTLQSRLIAVTRIQQGGKVGYGGTWTAPEDLLLGVVGVGYGDGYPQFAENNTPVLVNGKTVQLVGRVSMDMLTVDLRTQPHAKVGDPVILWGQGLPVEHIARHSRTSAYELLTGITARPKMEIM